MKLFSFLLLLATALVANAQTPTPTPCLAVGINPQFSDSNFDYTNFQGCYVQNPDGSTTATIQFGPAHTLGTQHGRLDIPVQHPAGLVTANGVTYTNWVNYGSNPVHVILLSFPVTTSPQTIMAGPAPTPTPAPTPLPAVLVKSGFIALAWSNSDSSVTGYNVYYGTAAGQETTKVSVGNNTAVSIALPAGAQYYFIVKSYNAAGAESPASNEISQTL